MLVSISRTLRSFFHFRPAFISTDWMRFWLHFYAFIFWVVFINLPLASENLLHFTAKLSTAVTNLYFLNNFSLLSRVLIFFFFLLSFAFPSLFVWFSTHLYIFINKRLIEKLFRFEGRQMGSGPLLLNRWIRCNLIYFPLSSQQWRKVVKCIHSWWWADVVEKKFHPLRIYFQQTFSL